jgi:membrane protein implicated in regulation of membrane protease activity
VLVEPIEHGSGKAKLGDGVWKVSGPELPAGARVRVVGVDGVVLKVIPA